MKSRIARVIVYPASGRCITEVEHVADEEGARAVGLAITTTEDAVLPDSTTAAIVAAVIDAQPSSRVLARIAAGTAITPADLLPADAPAAAPEEPTP